MRKGLLSGVLWGVNAVLLGIATSKSVCSLLLVPFISTFMNDFFSFLFTEADCLVKRETKMFSELKAKENRLLILAAVLSGPIGMTGYVLSITYMGSSIAAIASAIYPAIGCVLARFFLKEHMSMKQVIALALCSISIYLMSFTPDVNVINFFLGLVGTIACAIGWGVEAVLVSKSNTSLATLNILRLKYFCSSVLYVFLLVFICDFSEIISFISTSALFSILAAFAGLLSYKYYYEAIDEIGASKAMSCNMTYVACSVIFSLLVYKNFSDYGILSYLCIIIVLVTGIIAGGGIIRGIFKH